MTLGIILLLVVMAVFVLWPLFIQRLKGGHLLDAGGISRQQANITVYKEHVADLDESVKSGAIPESEYKTLKLELEKNFLQESTDSPAGNSAPGEKSPPLYSLFGGLVVLIAVSSVLLYQFLGATDQLKLKSLLEQRQQLQLSVPHASTTEYETVSWQSKWNDLNAEIIIELSDTLAANPDDLESRVLLARTAVEIEQYDLAIRHFREVLERSPEQPAIMAELAQVVFIASGNQILPVVSTLVNQALALEPENHIALGIAGIEAFQSENYSQAIEYWQKAIEVQGVNNPNSLALQRGIKTANQRLLEQGQDSVVSQSDEAATSQAPEAGGITIQVLLGEAVIAEPADTVFIYARAWEGARMPLSIARLSVSQLPTTLTLTNEMSMAPGMNLASAEQLELVARISKAGTPVPQSGDWQVTLGPVTLEGASEPYSLVISQQIP